MADTQNDPRPGDLKITLLRKILNRLQVNSIGTGTYVPWLPGDSSYEVYRKILTKLGGS